MRTILRHFPTLGALCLMAVWATSAQAQDQATYQFDLPEQPLADALRSIARQTGANVLFESKDLKGIKAPALRAQLTTAEAIERMLVGTKLEALRTTPTTVVVQPSAQQVSTSSLATDAQQQSSASTSEESRLARAEGENNQGMRKVEETSDPAEESHQLAIQEVVVTAQKRVERLQDVPVPVSAIDADALANANQLRLQDYYSKIPGLGLALIGDGGVPAITIRGIVTGGITNPTVGVVVDEVSYGASVSIGIAPSAPDIDPGDLARVEVLRGPQGTLYGASSIGGLLKYVTIDPSAEKFSGNVQAGVVSVHEGEIGQTLRGAINVPLSDTFAVRASAFTTREPGYVDNVRTGKDDVNRRDSDGGRLSALWRPSDVFSLKLSALIQDSERFGTGDVDTALGPGLTHGAIKGSSEYGRTTEAYSATMTATLGRVDLTSATGYNVDETKTAIDLTPSCVSFGCAASFGVTGGVGPLSREIEKFTQEVRVSLPVGERIHWLLGAFYTSEDTFVDLDWLAADIVTGEVAGTLLAIDQPAKFDERAAFTNLTFDITDRFDVQLGGRYSENEQSFSAVRSGSLQQSFYPDAPILPELDSKDSAFTYLLTPRLRVTPDFMTYARITSGYRPGGRNVNCGAAGVPCVFDPDTTKNYEIGFKGNLLGRALSFDASLYYIDWKDIQFQLTSSGIVHTGNAARAKSQGVELSMESKPLTGLTMSAWVVYNEAELTERTPATATNVSGRPGDRLPYSSRVSGNFSVEQEFPLWSVASGYAGASVSYVGDRKGLFRQAGLARETFPSYTQVDLRTGVRFGTWTVSAFVNNLADERGILRSGRDSLRSTFLTFIEPRTVGMSLNKRF
jgi:iron complex outermembrane recepter protein